MIQCGFGVKESPQEMGQEIQWDLFWESPFPLRYMQALFFHEGIYAGRSSAETVHEVIFSRGINMLIFGMAHRIINLQAGFNFFNNFRGGGLLDIAQFSLSIGVMRIGDVG